MHYAYIIKSLNDPPFWHKGETADPLARIQAHNKGANTSTRSRAPFTSILVLEAKDRSEAMRMEKSFKKNQRFKI